MEGLSRSLALVMLCAVLALNACNLFNPSGTGDPTGYDALVAEGVKCLKQQAFSEAKGNFEKALALRPHGDAAWDGWIESRFGEVEKSTGVTMSRLVTEVRKIPSTTTKPFWGSPLEEQDRFYRYLRAMDSAETRYLKGIERDSFSDASDQLAYRSIKSAYVLLRVCDFNSDGRIDARDTALINVCSNDPGGLTKDKVFIQDKLKQLALGLSDSVTGAPRSDRIAEFNTLISASDSLFRALGILADGSKTWAQLDTFTQTRGQEVSFYKGADLKDNDGDGCVDEEIIDGYDNDGDGFVDEDFRTGLLDTARLRSHPQSPVLVTPQDNLDTSRLVGGDAVTGLTRNDWNPAATDSSDALLYVTGAEWVSHPGLFRRYRSYALETHPDYPVKHWKRKVEWNSQTLISLGLVSSDVPLVGDSAQGMLTHEQLTKVRKAVLSIDDPASRIRAGRALVGGCWMDVSLPVAGRRP
jgi:hypothetical protein